MATVVLLYINPEGGMLNGEKQMVANKNSKEVQITAFSSCQLLPGPPRVKALSADHGHVWQVPWDKRQCDKSMLP